MSYRVEADVHIVFEDGKALIPLQDQYIDLFKLESVQDFHVVLATIAQSVVVSSVSVSPPKPPATEPTQGPDFSAHAEKLRQTFQEISDRADAKLREVAGIDGYPAKDDVSG